MKLEELARQSSDAARASVVHLDPPPIGDPSGRAAWHIPTLIGVAALILVAGIATALLLDDGGGDGGAGESIVAGTQDIPRLGLPELSAWNLTAAVDLATFADEVGGGASFEYYGTRALDDPFAEGDLLIVTIANARGEDLAQGGAEPVTVRGVDGWVATGTQVGGGLPPDTNLVQWVEPGSDVGIAVASRSMTVDELLAVADGLVVAGDDGGEAVVRVAEDVGLERVASSTASPLFGGGGLQPGSVGWLVAYEQALSDQPASLVLVTAADELRSVATELRFWSTDFATTTVDGTSGFLAWSAIEFDGATTHVSTVAWEPAPGVVATLLYSGAEPDLDLVALAETAAVLDDDAWQQAELMAQRAESPASEYDIVFGEGAGVVGEVTYSWAIGLRDDDLCIDIQTGSSGTGSCRPFGELEAEELETARSIDNGFGPDLASVVIMGANDVEAVRETSGVGVIERVNAVGRSWFVYIGESDHEPRFDVIIDGEVMDTIEAAVEEIASASPIDVGSHPSARELGIAEEFEAVLSVADPELSVAVGTVEGQTCVVSDFPTLGAWCSPGDIVQFRQTDGSPDPTDSVLIVVTSPPCGEGPARMVVDGVAVGSIGEGSTSTGAAVSAWFLPRAGDELVVSVTHDDGSRHSLTITGDAAEGAQTDVTAVDNASWPPGLCG